MYFRSIEGLALWPLCLNLVVVPDLCQLVFRCKVMICFNSFILFLS